MRKRCLDTNVLIDHFLHSLKPLLGKSSKDAEASARSLIAARNTDIILSPTAVEFLCGILNQDEMRLREAFLKPFHVLDQGRTLPEDWEEARRFAKHAGHHARPRDLGDCLITAIADRLNLEVETDDKGLRTQKGRTRQKRL
jgi:predicted nucleic acid-binding protein